MPSDSQLLELLATRDIIETIDALFMATDAKDWQRVRDVFAPTVHFDMASAGGGPAAERAGADIAGDWERGLASLQAIHHQAGNYRVRSSGDRAEASCYGIAYHYMPKASGRSTRVFVGSYDFELQQMDGRWRISLFRYTLKFVDGNRDLEHSE
jgi:hypothetical protein